MNSLVGELEWHVWVKCPHCREAIDLADDDANNDYLLAGAVFGSKDTSCNWDNITIEYECTECNELFVLEKIEY